MAIAYKDSVCVNRLCGDRLEEISRIELSSLNLLWLADLLIVYEYNASTKLRVIVEFEFSGMRLDRRCKLLDFNYARIRLASWCAVVNELAIFDNN